MTIRIKYFAIIGLILCCACKPQNSTQKTIVNENKKPNIIFLFSDDQSFKTINALGNKEISTPTLDKLVKEGTTFTHTYNMGGWNGAICLASRAMIISGRSIWRAKEIGEKYQANKELEKTWPKLMETEGYETYMTGKWHVKAKADSIFNHIGHIYAGMPKQTKEGYNRPKSVNDTLWKPWKKEFGGYWKGGKHWSEVVKEDAVSFIENASKKANPFFMYIAFNAPHDPRQAPKKYVDMYPLEDIAMPESFVPVNRYAEQMGSGKELRDEKLAPFPRTALSVKTNRQEYYAIITHMDQQLKEIIEALEKKGLKENTYIFFTSDHGLAAGEHGLMGKQNMYEHSTRVPFMIVGPDIPKGKKVDTDIYLQDAMATVLELGGVKKPPYVEFNSVLNLAKGSENKGQYKSIYGVYKENAQRMIRKDNYKLILYPRSKELLLFNLNEDPQELKDIASNPENLAKTKLLFKDLIQLQKEKGDLLDLEAIYKNII